MTNLEDWEDSDVGLFTPTDLPSLWLYALQILSDSTESRTSKRSFSLKSNIEDDVSVSESLFRLEPFESFCCKCCNVIIFGAEECLGKTDGGLNGVFDVVAERLGFLTFLV